MEHSVGLINFLMQASPIFLCCRQKVGLCKHIQVGRAFIFFSLVLVKDIGNQRKVVLT